MAGHHRHLLPLEPLSQLAGKQQVGQLALRVGLEIVVVGWVVQMVKAAGQGAGKVVSGCWHVMLRRLSACDGM